MSFAWETGQDLLTATIRLSDAVFANMGPEGTDFAIRSVQGVDAAFLLVRVIESG